MERIKVLVVEGQEILRDAYINILASEPSIGLVGKRDGGCLGAADTEAIRQVLKSSRPHVLLLGTDSIGNQALDMLEAVHDEFPDVGVILLAHRYEAGCLGRLKTLAGNHSRGAYLLKSSVGRARDLIRIVRDVMHGQILIDHQVFAGLIREGNDPAACLDQLTPRELDILTWLAMGYRNSAIAAMLSLEPRTVERHVSTIFSKLANRDADRMHPRVAAALSYLAANGALEPREIPVST